MSLAHRDLPSAAAIDQNRRAKKIATNASRVDVPFMDSHWLMRIAPVNR